MTFAAPQMFWLFLLVPVLFAFFWWSWRVRQKLMEQFIQARLLPGLIAGVSSQRQKIRAGLVIGAVIFLIIALARLQFGYTQEEIPQRELDIVVAVDTSKSMLTADIAPNRLTRAKLAALGLMQEGKSDRLGLVAFAGSAFLVSPLTIDDAAFQQSVDSLDVNTISEGGTSLSEAINEARKAFKEGDNYKVLVLFTDGEDNDTDTGAIEAAKAAAKDGVRIFTVGIGTAEGDLIQIKGQDGSQQYVRDDQGNVVKSHLNEPLLRQIASESGGAYYSLSGANTMEALYQRSLAPLPRSEKREQWVKRPHEQYHWPLAIGILLLIAEIFFPERQPSQRREKKGERTPSNAGSNSSAAVVGAIVLLLVLPMIALGSPQSAVSDYKAGKFAAAQKEFEQLAVTDKKHSTEMIFNAGDAAYRATNYDDALKFYTAALDSQDVKLQQKAYFNIGNVHYRQGEQQKDLDDVQGLWEQAVTNYQSAVELDKNDPDAAHNLDYAKKSVVMVQQMKEAARRARLAADNSVRQRQYHRALEIMEQAVQNNIAAKQFQDYMKRLKDIDEIATPTPTQH